MSENNETSVEAGNESTTESAQDYTAVINQLRAELESERAEKLLVDGKNKELVREKQRVIQESARIEAEKAGDIQAIHALHEADKKALDDRLRTLTLDAAIKSSLATANVRPELYDGAEAYLFRKAVYKDGEATIDGLPIKNYAAIYFGSDVGRHYVKAPSNSGGGASGSNGTVASAPFSEMEYQRRYQQNPSDAIAWARSTGNDWITK